MKTLIFILAAWLTSFAANLPTSREIVEKAGETIDFSSMEMTTTLKIFDNKGRERVRSISVAGKQFGETNKMIMSFTAPPDVRGTSILIYDYEKKADDMWIYLPALRKTRRIVSSERGRSFMGSEFSNADMSRPNTDDFEYHTPDEVTFESQNCWKIEATANSDETADGYGYRKKILWIEKQHYLTLKIEYYDTNQELLKIQTFSDYRKQSGGKYFAFGMEMVNVQNGRKSVMIIDRFQQGSALEESRFTPAMLEN